MEGGEGGSPYKGVGCLQKERGEGLPFFDRVWMDFVVVALLTQKQVFHLECLFLF